jgi:hypothetical protein
MDVAEVSREFSLPPRRLSLFSEDGAWNVEFS